MIKATQCIDCGFITEKKIDYCTECGSHFRIDVCFPEEKDYYNLELKDNINELD